MRNWEPKVTAHCLRCKRDRLDELPFLKSRRQLNGMNIYLADRQCSRCVSHGVVVHVETAAERVATQGPGVAKTHSVATEKKTKRAKRELRQ